MSDTTPPSIPPRKKSGADQKKSGGSSGSPAKADEPVGTGTSRTGTSTKATGKSGRSGSSGSAGKSRSSAAEVPAAVAPSSPAAVSPADPAVGTSTVGTSTLPGEQGPATATTSGGRAAFGTSPARSDETTKTKKATGAGPRRVRLAISRVDPWSVMKLAFLISFAAGIMLVVAAAVIWLTLDGLEVFAKINDLATEILADSDIDLLQYVAFDRVISVATLIAIVDIFLITALATIGAFLYNITAALVGGVHVTMTDE